MIPIQPFVLAEDLSLEAQAKKLAKELHLLYKGNFQDLKKQNKYFRDSIEKKYFFILGEDRSYLKLGLSSRNKPIYCDFLNWSKSLRKSNLIRSMKGIPEECTVIDATAGLGQDALSLATLSRKIVLLERVPWIHALLKEGLKKTKIEDSLIQRMEAICVDSKYYLSALKQKVDVIYLDPMFTNMGKSKAKKETQALRELTDPNKNKGLLDISLKKAKERVIVKRHRNSKYFEGVKPSFFIKGRVLRYDVYKPKFN
tara:strand:+ start:782 stop:1549 length:768 start_codon:yes stop_codon:yes gene_type:complete